MEFSLFNLRMPIHRVNATGNSQWVGEFPSYLQKIVPVKSPCFLGFKAQESWRGLIPGIDPSTMGWTSLGRCKDVFQLATSQLLDAGAPQIWSWGWELVQSADANECLFYSPASVVITMVLTITCGSKASFMFFFQVLQTLISRLNIHFACRLYDVDLNLLLYLWAINVLTHISYFLLVKHGWTETQLVQKWCSHWKSCGTCMYMLL